MKQAVLLSCALLLLAPSHAAAAPDLSEIIVDVNEEKQPVRTVLRRLQARHGLNYVVSEEVLAQAGTVTVQLKAVPLDDALQAICAACGLDLSIRGSILVMLPQGGRGYLPKSRAGLVPKGGAQTSPLSPREAREAERAGADRFMSRKRPDSPAPTQEVEPDAPPRARGGMMMVGNVAEVDMEKGRLQLKGDGIKRDFYLAEGESGHSMQNEKLRRAFAGMQPGHRVALLYVRIGKRSVVTDLIGGDRVREAQVPTQADRRRRRRGPAPFRAGAPKPGPDAKAAPAQPAKKVVPEGVLAGRFVSHAGDLVKIKRADDQVVDCYLPTDDPEGRAKLEAVITTLKPDTKVFMTYKKDAKDRLVLRGGISEVN